VPNQLVPLATKVSISTAEAVAVIVGAVPPGYLTPVKVAVVMPVAACVRIRIKLLPAVAVGIVTVQGVEAVKVAVWKVPLVKEIVVDAPIVPIATTPSV
jgi:hypothetical protein